MDASSCYWPPGKPLAGTAVWKAGEEYLQTTGRFGKLTQLRAISGVPYVQWTLLEGELGILPLPKELKDFYAHRDGVGGVFPGEEEGLLKHFQFLPFKQIVEAVRLRLSAAIESEDELEEALPPTNNGRCGRKRLVDGGRLPIMVWKRHENEFRAENDFIINTTDLNSIVYVDCNPDYEGGGQLHQIVMVKRPDYGGSRSQILASNWSNFVNTHLLRRKNAAQVLDNLFLM